MKNYLMDIMLKKQKSHDGEATGQSMDKLLSWKLRTSSSIYPFQEKALKTWKLECATPKKWDENVVFFGMYHKGDWESFIKHTGKKIVIWAGGDIRNLLRGYAYSDGKELW
jgi:hypothetical protein